MCKKLSENEYNGLNKIAHETKMDCWFFIIKSGEEDLIHDIENDEILTLANGLSQFAEGIIDPLDSYKLSDEEIEAVKNLFNEFNIIIDYERE